MAFCIATVVRGALDHPYLNEFASHGFWGKYPFGRTIPGRETFPPAGHYKPHLMVTQAASAGTTTCWRLARKPPAMEHRLGSPRLSPSETSTKRACST